MWRSSAITWPHNNVIHTELLYLPKDSAGSGSVVGTVQVGKESLHALAQLAAESLGRAHLYLAVLRPHGEEPLMQDT